MRSKKVEGVITPAYVSKSLNYNELQARWRYRHTLDAAARGLHIETFCDCGYVKPVLCVYHLPYYTCKELDRWLEREPLDV